VITILTDPVSITYDGNAKSLPRVSASRVGNVYRTSNDEFEVSISDLSRIRGGKPGCEIVLTRVVPDPTPTDLQSRRIANSFGFVISFDPVTRTEASDNLPKLRAALDSFVNTTMLNRLIAGEK